MINSDHYFKKRIEYKFQRELYFFDVPYEVFSTFKVDRGSHFLLDSMLRGKPKRTKYKKILDLGCGYGPLGIILARYFTSSSVTMVDKDLLALRYAKMNAKLNNVSDQTNVLGSIGIEEVKEDDFDLIISNIPAKIGDKAIEEEFILRPIELLSKNGQYWFVVVNALNRLIPRIGRKNKLNLKQVGKQAGHSVYRYR